MLYHVKMDVIIPSDIEESELQEIIAQEREYSQKLQRDGKWPQLWRITGEYANFSIFDVEDHNALHEILISLPLFKYLKIKVTPLSLHPSKI